MPPSTESPADPDGSAELRPRDWGHLACDTAVLPDDDLSLAVVFTWTGSEHTASIWGWRLGGPDASARLCHRSGQQRGFETATLVAGRQLFGSQTAAAGEEVATCRLALVPGPRELAPPIWIPGAALIDVKVAQRTSRLDIIATRHWSGLTAVDFPPVPDNSTLRA